MTKVDHTADVCVLVGIDISKHRHEVLIAVPGKTRRRRLTITNTTEEFTRLVTILRDYGLPVRIGFEATGNYHRVLMYHLGMAGFDLKLVSSVALARTREALHDSWDKNDPKDAQVILHMLQIGAVQTTRAFISVDQRRLPTEASIAHVLVSKYADHLPLYRQSQILTRAGLDLHRAVLADWVGKAAFHLKPVVDRLAEHLKRSDKLFMDETTAPVLAPRRGVTKTGYLWALARDDRPWGGEDPPGVVYFYAPGRAGENAETFLTGFDGILQIDGYTGYNRLTKPTRKGGTPIRVAHCWARARRKLKEVFDRDGSEIAAEGLRRIAEIYAVESDIRGISPGQRLSARQTRSAPLVAAFGDWLLAKHRKISDKARAVALIRAITLNRKNALFAGLDEGGTAWGRIASLIETCKINGIEPFAYLKATVTAIANVHPQSRLDDLLPRNFKPSS